MAFVCLNGLNFKLDIDKTLNMLTISHTKQISNTKECTLLRKKCLLSGHFSLLDIGISSLPTEIKRPLCVSFQKQNFSVSNPRPLPIKDETPT